MESVIATWLTRYESGALTRRQLIQGLAMLATAALIVISSFMVPLLFSFRIQPSVRGAEAVPAGQKRVACVMRTEPINSRRVKSQPTGGRVRMWVPDVRAELPSRPITA